MFRENRTTHIIMFARVALQINEPDPSSPSSSSQESGRSGNPGAYRSALVVRPLVLPTH